ncbi:MAG: DUF4339 domain-containing protein [Thermoguttaceae bacterium]|nr:DUF4339 domain-containing protein [Thermoguttaceae bacterium]
MDSPLYVRVRGKVLGPFVEEKLLSMARQGHLSRLHEVSTDGVSWVRASTYPELFAVASIPETGPKSVGMSEGYTPPSTHAQIESALAPASPAQVPVALSPERMWYYDDFGSEAGPFPESTIRQLIDSGSISRETCVWTKGFPAWTPVRNVPDLCPAGDRVPPPEAWDGTLPEREQSSSSTLITAALASNPWAISLAITWIVLTAIFLIFWVVLLLSGVRTGSNVLVTQSLVSLFIGCTWTGGAIMLLGYANALSRLRYERTTTSLARALEKLRLFWGYACIATVGMVVLLALAILFAIVQGITSIPVPW